MKTLNYTIVIAALTAFGALVGPSPTERVWQPGPEDDAYDVSPDGRNMAYIDWNTGNLMVRDIQAGVNRDVTRKGTYKESPDEAESALYSPDGGRIAYEWWDGKTKTDELRIINADGSGVRTLFRETGVSVWPEDFSPDGRFILTTLDATKGARRFALIPVDGGPPRPVREVTGRNIDVRFSPDGRFLMYSVSDEHNDFRRDVFALSLADNRVWPIVEHKADDYVIGFAAGGARLVFGSDRGGSPGVWTLPLNNGRAAGPATLVRGDLWRMMPLRLTKQGKFFYHVAAGDRDVFSAPIDLETGRLQSPPVSLTRHPGENYLAQQWSPDGKYVAYLVREASGVRHRKLYVHSVGGDEVRQFLPRVFNPRGFMWEPKSQAMIIAGDDSAGNPGLYRFDMSKGRPQPFLGNTLAVTAFTGDGRTMYYSPRGKGVDTSTALIARDVVTGKERVIYRHPAGGRINANAVSPDGKYVILVYVSKQTRGWGPTAAFAVSIANGTARNLGESIPSDPMRETQRHIGFTPDGKSAVVMTQRTDSTQLFALWRVPLDGGRAVRLPNAPPELEHNQAAGSWLSPDGRRILFASGRQSREVWTLDDPALRGGR